MSEERGRPVMLTRGERRLLISLCANEMEWLEDEVRECPADADGPTRNRVGVMKTRIRQYRRLIRELCKPEPMPANERGGG